jgi:hypothetical protein
MRTVGFFCKVLHKEPVETCVNVKYINDKRKMNYQTITKLHANTLKFKKKVQLCILNHYFEKKKANMLGHN